MNCLDCDKGLCVKNTSGRCMQCGNRFRLADPDFQARRNAGIQRKWAEPAYRAKMALKARLHAHRMNADEAVMAKRRVAASIVAREVLHRPDIRERTLAAVREKSGKTQSASRIAWCPEEHRPLYWYMRRTKRMTLAEPR